MIEITVNNKPHQLGGETTVEALLEELLIEKAGTAVALNGQVVPRSKHQSVVVLQGDNLEIIRAVGGG